MLVKCSVGLLMISSLPFYPLVVDLNITSLVKHIDELRILLADTPVDVLSINETRLDDSVKDSDVYIPGYELFAGTGR